MTLQRRLILAVLLGVAIAWSLTSVLIYLSTQEEINELYDTAMVRMAQQMQAMLPLINVGAVPQPPPQNAPCPAMPTWATWATRGWAISPSPRGGPAANRCISTRTATACPARHT